MEDLVVDRGALLEVLQQMIRIESVNPSLVNGSDIHYPIIEGGLAHLGYAELAAAISNAGALGQKPPLPCRTKSHSARRSRESGD